MTRLFICQSALTISNYVVLEINKTSPFDEAGSEPQVERFGQASTLIPRFPVTLILEEKGLQLCKREAALSAT